MQKNNKFKRKFLSNALIGLSALIAGPIAYVCTDKLNQKNNLEEKEYIHVPYTLEDEPNNLIMELQVQGENEKYQIKIYRGVENPEYSLTELYDKKNKNSNQILEVEKTLCDEEINIEPIKEEEDLLKRTLK